MEGDESKPLYLPDESQLSELTDRTAENVVEFQQFVDEIFEEIDQDEKFSDMTADSYNQKKAYMKSHIRGLSGLHNTMADQFGELIQELSKNFPSVTQNQHLQSSESSSSPQVTQTVAPNFSRVTGFDLLWQPSGSGFYLSKVERSSHSSTETSMSSVNKPAVQPSSDNALKAQETKDSGSDSSMASVNKAPVPLVNDDAFKVKETKDPGCVGSDSGSESSMSSVNKPLTTPVSNDALKVKETKDSRSEKSMLCFSKPEVQPVSDDALKVEGIKASGSETSMSSVNESPVPPVNDDALNVEETKDTGLESFMPPVNETLVPPVNADALNIEGESSMSSVSKIQIPPENNDTLNVEQTGNSGPESSMSSVNEPPVQPADDDALEVEESNEDLLENVSILKEEVGSLKQKLQNVTDENGKLKQEIEQNITDVGEYMHLSTREIKGMEEELQASKEFANTIDKHLCRELAEKVSNQVKHGSEIIEMDMKITQYKNEISRLKRTHEKKKKIWSGVNEQLRDELKEKSKSLDDVSQNIEALIIDKSDQNKEIHKLKTELISVKLENAELLPSFENVQKITDELKLKVVELETEVNKQTEAMSKKDKE